MGILHAVGLEPSQVPWHGLVPAQAVRVPRGCPEFTVLHVPMLSFSAQAWHCPAHRSLQQTLSVQKPSAQSSSLWQEEPTDSLLSGTAASRLLDAPAEPPVTTLPPTTLPPVTTVPATGAST